MSALGAAFVLVNVVALLCLPRKLAPLPFLLGACYMTVGQVVLVGPFHFSVVRLLVAAGLCRVLVRGERLAGGVNVLDRLVVAWAAWAIASSAFHENPTAALVYRLGLAYDACGIYFLFRMFLQTYDDVMRLCRLTALVLGPVALAMLGEVVTRHNVFSVLGGVDASPAIREGLVRAQGPFVHSILAGSVGGASLPLMVGLWRRFRREAVVGSLACLVMMGTCGSTGPVMSVVAGIGGLFAWRLRGRVRSVLLTAVLAYVAVDLVGTRPAYYQMDRIDVTGGSTGWHRARLIEAAVEHLGEWWLGGTDYTRHWVATGVGWSEAHTDIVNYYILMGVTGGLPLMLLFIAVLGTAFVFVGESRRRLAEMASTSEFAVWALGSSLFAHCVTFIAVSYHDQSFVFLYVLIAGIGSLRGYMAGVRKDVAEEEPQPAVLATRAWWEPEPGGSVHAQATKAW